MITYDIFLFIHLSRSVLTISGYCTRKIERRIAIPKEALNRKRSLLTNKLNTELTNKFGVLYCMLRDLDTMKYSKRSIWGASKNAVLE